MITLHFWSISTFHAFTHKFSIWIRYKFLWLNRIRRAKCRISGWNLFYGCYWKHSCWLRMTINIIERRLVLCALRMALYHSNLGNVSRRYDRILFHSVSWHSNLLFLRCMNLVWCFHTLYRVQAMNTLLIWVILKWADKFFFRTSFKVFRDFKQRLILTGIFNFHHIFWVPILLNGISTYSFLKRCNIITWITLWFFHLNLILL